MTKDSVQTWYGISRFLIFLDVLVYGWDIERIQKTEREFHAAFPTETKKLVIKRSCDFEEIDLQEEG